MKKRLFGIIMAMLLIFSIGNATTNAGKVLQQVGKEQAKEISKEEKAREREIKKETKIIKNFKKTMKEYELEAVIKTSKGDIKVFLYPEAAPVNVANFVYLAQHKFYNGLKFHRVISNVLAQGGDPEGTGVGDPGYTLNDEIVDWLNFDEPGVLAMANSGPNTNGSQFFLTVTSLPQLNEKYTVIGGIASREDLSVIRVLRQDDVILGIDILGNKVNTFLNNFTEEVKDWDSRYTGRK